MSALSSVSSGCQSPRGRWRLFIGALMLAASAPCVGAVAVPPCGAGLFSVRAMVSAMTPREANVVRRPKGSAASAPLTIGTTLCAGDSLIFGNPRDGSTVELFEAGKFRTIRSEVGSETVVGGTRGALDQASAYVNAVFSGNLGVLLKPGPTGIRGSGGPAAEGGLQLRPIAPLYGLPHQKVTPGTRLLVSWRDGAGPYRCEASDDAGKVLWSQGGVSNGRCEVPGELRGVTTVVVREASEHGIKWYLDAAPPQAMPRPEWWGGTANRDGAPERTAWAIWLWQHHPEWRLQALAMLNAEAPREFIAGYFVERVLAGDPPI